MPPLPRRAEGDEDDDDEEDLDDDDEEDLDEEDLDGATATTSATTGRSRVTCLGIQSVGLYAGILFIRNLPKYLAGAPAGTLT